MLNISSENSFQKQPTKVFYKKGVLKNFEFTGKHLCRSLFQLGCGPIASDCFRPLVFVFQTVNNKDEKREE